MKCFICGSNVDSHNLRHIYWCAKNNEITGSKQEIRYKQICFYVGFEITKEFLEREYLQLGKSLPDFKKQYGLAYTQTVFLLTFLGIKRRTSSDSNMSPQFKEKYLKTCLEKYGVQNVSQFEGTKRKKRETSLKNFGVDNIWKERDFIVKKMKDKYGSGSVPNINGKANYWGWKTISPEDKNKRIKKMNLAWTKYWKDLSDEEKTILIQKRCRSMVSYFTSSLEVRIQRILSDFGIDFVWQKWISSKSYDFQIVGTNLLIEIQGDFWHCNPAFYDQNDKVKFHIGLTAKDIWNRDNEKRAIAEKYGYRILYLWESEINSKKDKEIAELLLKEITPNTK